MSTKQQKKQMIKDASDAIIFAHSVSYNDSTHEGYIAIPLSDIADYSRKDLKMLVNVPTFKGIKLGQFNLIFLYETGND